MLKVPVLSVLTFDLVGCASSSRGYIISTGNLSVHCNIMLSRAGTSPLQAASLRFSPKPWVFALLFLTHFCEAHLKRLGQEVGSSAIL